MFRRLTDRISSAASSVLGSEDPRVQRLVALGFDATSASSALQATNYDVDRAAELLLASGGSVGAGAPPAAMRPPPPAAAAASDEDATLQRVMQESYQMEQQRQRERSAVMNRAADAAAQRAAAAPGANHKKKTKAAAKKPIRAAAVNKAADAAAQRATGAKPQLATKTSSDLSAHHPDVKLVPKLSDKSKEEQIIRCADRLKSSHQAVDTLYRALSAVQSQPDNAKFRKVDKTTAGYQRSLANAPGAEDFLKAMNYRAHGTQSLVLDRAMVDPALLYLGISALEQTKLTPEYQQSKALAVFAKQVGEIRLAGDSSETEAIARAALMVKCPTEPADGRGALMQVVLAEETLRRRFDGDDTLQDVLHWLGAHGTVIRDKILSREWSLVDRNRYPVAPIDCVANQHHTLQFIGCWPSGRLEVVPSTEGWKEGGSGTGRSGGTGAERAGSSRGLGAAPTDAVYQS